MMICESCGMPMDGAKTHGGHDENNEYCAYCTDSKGKLKSRSEVREGIIGYMVKHEKRTRDEAEKLVEEHMSRMPAWSRKS